MEYAPITEIKRNLASLDEAGRIADRIAAIYQELKNTDLEPSGRVNDLFRELVAIVQSVGEPVSRVVLAQGKVRLAQESIREVCALGETKLENFWALRDLKDFPYLDNYKKLISLELDALRAVEKLPKRILFAGSGPLPLSAILLAKETGASVDCLDFDKAAVEISEKLIAKLGLNDKIKILSGDVRQFASFAKYDAIFLAALVGESGEKEGIINHIGSKMTPGSVLLVRSAHLLRSLLYPEATPEMFRVLEIKKTIHPMNEIINSVIIAQKSNE